MRANQHDFRGLRNARRSHEFRSGLYGLCHNDRLLAANEEPPLGCHLVTPRRGFAHHGIYVGRGNVVQYKSLVRHLCRGSVEEVSLAHFAHTRTIWVRHHSSPRFDGIEVTQRALSRLGEARYRVLSNNCEHFCEWCLQGEHRSYQVERLLALPRRFGGIWGEVIAWLRPDHSCGSRRAIGVLRAVPPSRGR